MENDQGAPEQPRDENPEDYVGYRNPPKGKRWAPGFCPNPRGRPRQAFTRKAVLARIANELCEVKIAGKIQRRTKFEVLLFAVRNATANGDEQARKLFAKLLNEVPEDAQMIEKGVLIIGEKLSAEEWEIEYGYLGGGGCPPPPPKPVRFIHVRHLLRSGR